MRPARTRRYEVLVLMTQEIFALFWDVMLFSLVKTLFLRGNVCHKTLH
jgi:hypothetical protein